MQFEVHKKVPPTSCQIPGNHWKMHHVHPYSMYGFLQLIIDGSPNKHPGKKEKQGEKEKRIQAKTQKKQYVFYFWIRIVERNRFPELTSFWLHFTLKECNLKFTKGHPHKLPNSRQSLKNAPCSSIFYVWVSAADNWWQPKQTSRKKGKARGEREENASEHPKKQYVFYFWIRIVERNRFPELTSFWLHFTLKECNLKFTKGPPHKLPNSRQSLKNAPCSSIFYVWVSAADTWWQPKQTSRKKGKARGEREENTSEHPWKNNTSITFGPGLWTHRGLSNWAVFILV